MSDIYGIFQVFGWDLWRVIESIALLVIGIEPAVYEKYHSGNTIDYEGAACLTSIRFFNILLDSLLIIHVLWNYKKQLQKKS